MVKPKAQSNKEHIEKVRTKGGKTFQLLLTKEEVELLEEFKERHRLLTNKEFFRFCVTYKVSSFNEVVAVPAGEIPAGDCFIYKGIKFQILDTPTYGSMCRDVETGFVFPTP
jgi:hypothetical protein